MVLGIKRDPFTGLSVARRTACACVVVVSVVLSAQNWRCKSLTCPASRVVKLPVLLSTASLRLAPVHIQYRAGYFVVLCAGASLS